jgi:hypothetical protein
MLHRIDTACNLIPMIPMISSNGSRTSQKLGSCGCMGPQACITLV